MSDRSDPPASCAPRAYVLVHGAWHGAWCWERVSPLLTARGHRVLTPDLGSSRADAEVSLGSHVDDVLRAIDAARPDSFVLVGHSYGGIVISAVADALRSRVSHCVYLDAAVPADMAPGASIAWCDFYDAPECVRRMEAARDGGAIAAPPARSFGVDDAGDGAWLQARLRPMPLGTFTGRFTFRNGGSDGLRRSYVAFTSPPYAPLAATRERVRADPSWSFATLAAGHDAMVTAPGAVADLLTDARIIAPDSPMAAATATPQTR